MDKVKIGDGEYVSPFTCDADYDNPSDWIRDANENSVDYEDATAALNELVVLRQERDALKARVDTRDALINVMAPMHQLTCRNHKTCPICKAYDKYSKEIDGGSVDTTPGGDDGEK